MQGSAWGPVTLPVFKTGGRHLSVSSVGSTPTRFRHTGVSEAKIGPLAWDAIALLESESESHFGREKRRSAGTSGRGALLFAHCPYCKSL